MKLNNKLLKKCALVLGTATSLFAYGIAQNSTERKNTFSTIMQKVHYQEQNNDNKQHIDVPKDFLTTRELIHRNGYEYKQYRVKTEDGYILRAHRIISPRPGGPPVLIQHGFIAASDSLVWDKEQSLAFQLANAGYDVWLTDLRGNWYSRNHIKYKANDMKFWEFTFHESGIYDLPAFIECILHNTGYSQLYYIGHSMGTTVFFVMNSMRPEYNKKIKLAVLLAPVAITPNLQEIKSSLFRLLLVQADIIYQTLKKIGIYEFMPRTYNNIISLRKFCGPSVTQDYCLDFLAMGYGENRENLDRSVIGRQVSYLPAGSSINTAHHLTQIYRKGFRQYDYGPTENLRRYNSEEPPHYPLHKVTAPIALFWGDNDMLVNKRAVNELAEKLPNLIKNYQILDPKFTHIDFIYGLNSPDKCYNEIINVFNEF